MNQAILKKLPPTLSGFLRKHLPLCLKEGASTVHLFKPVKNKETGRWRDPVYSLRRQAVLRKEAERYGLLSLLPMQKEAPRKPMRGLFHWKGTLSERTRKRRAEQIQKALEEQPKKIAEWKAKRKKTSEKDIFTS